MTLVVEPLKNIFVCVLSFKCYDQPVTHFSLLTTPIININQLFWLKKKMLEPCMPQNWKLLYPCIKDYMSGREVG